MIHSVDPRQNRLFDPFEGVIPPAGRKIIANGWQGVFRHALLEVMPVDELAQHFSKSLGAHTKELYSMAGLVFLADFFDWTAQEAVEAYIFRSDVQYALNLEPGAALCTRTLERYQQLFRDNDLAARVFDKVTTKLVDALDLDVSRQRLDSTHVFSHMATFGRTKLMAVAIKRFLTQLQRHDSDAYAALPEDFRHRYTPAQSRLFADAKDADARARYRQQAAEDLHFLITRFADRPDHTNRSTYQALITIFGQQCELSGEKIVVKAKTGGDCIQNPSDLDATYSGHKGPGYQVQIAETCVPENEVQLITAALPQTACELDAARWSRCSINWSKPGESLRKCWPTRSTPAMRTFRRPRHGAWTWSALSPAAPEADTEAMTVDDFAWDERHRRDRHLPRGSPADVVPPTRRRLGRESRCPLRRAVSARFASNVRSRIHVMVSSLWNSPTRSVGLRDVAWKRRPRCTRSVTRRVPGSSRPIAA